MPGWLNGWTAWRSEETPDKSPALLCFTPGADPKEILSNVMEGMKEFVGSAEQFDDIAMLCFKYNGPRK